MEKAKAAKILLEEYDTLSCRRMLCNKPDDIDYLNDFLIALLTAIDVLNQSSSVEAEPMGEYISREEVVKKIKSCISVADDAWDSGYNTAMAEIMEWIKYMPTADVQPVKRGRWVWDSNAPHRDYGAYKCSNCGCHSDFEENFCPNCGCKQDLDGDSE